MIRLKMSNYKIIKTNSLYCKITIMVLVFKLMLILHWKNIWSKKQSGSLQNKKPNLSNLKFLNGKTMKKMIS